MKRLEWPGVLGLVVLLCSGCAGSGQPSLKVDYYTLEYEAHAPAERSALSCVIEVKRFSVAPEVNSDRIIFRDAAYRRNEYVYHRWRANPADLVTFHLARDLRSTGLFSAVYALTSAMQPTHLLEGVVEGFHEEDGAERWYAVLSISVSLLDRLEPDVTRRVIFQKQYSEREPCSRKNPEALAEALSRAMARISERVSSDVYQSLAKNDESGPVQ